MDCYFKRPRFSFSERKVGWFLKGKGGTKVSPRVLGAYYYWEKKNKTKQEKTDEPKKKPPV